MNKEGAGAQIVAKLSKDPGLLGRWLAGEDRSEIAGVPPRELAEALAASPELISQLASAEPIATARAVAAEPTLMARFIGAEPIAISRALAAEPTVLAALGQAEPSLFASPPMPIEAAALSRFASTEPASFASALSQAILHKAGKDRGGPA